jgi:hypothetical protein
MPTGIFLHYRMLEKSHTAMCKLENFPGDKPRTPAVTRLLLPGSGEGKGGCWGLENGEGRGRGGHNGEDGMGQSGEWEEREVEGP